MKCKVCEERKRAEEEHQRKVAEIFNGILGEGWETREEDPVDVKFTPEEVSAIFDDE
jgi:hypothetical protein